MTYLIDHVCLFPDYRITQGAGKDGFSFENGEAERQMPAIEEAREYEEQEEARLEYAPNQEDEGLGKEIEEGKIYQFAEQSFSVKVHPVCNSNGAEYSVMGC